MPYTKTNWIDDVTPISATNMNKIEQGIFDAIPLTQKAAANGVASLGSDGRVPTAQRGTFADNLMVSAGIVSTVYFKSSSDSYNGTTYAKTGIDYNNKYKGIIRLSMRLYIMDPAGHYCYAVSYTHLTLPTILLV